MNHYVGTLSHQHHRTSEHVYQGCKRCAACLSRSRLQLYYGDPAAPALDLDQCVSRQAAYPVPTHESHASGTFTYFLAARGVGGGARIPYRLFSG